MNSQSPLDQAEISSFVARLVRAGETNASIARAVERGFEVWTTESAIRRFRKRHDLNIPGTVPAYTKVHGDDAECLCKPSDKLETDPDRMLTERGLDPIKWYIDAITVNEWEGLKKGGQSKTKLYQTKFTAKRKQPYQGLMPVRSDGWRPAQGRVAVNHSDFEVAVIVGDFHAPFHDEHLNQLFCKWLEVNQPERGINLGDLVDFPDISRHPNDPENMAYANECLQSGYGILRSHVTASPDTHWELFGGNHDDERIRNYLLKYAPYLYDLKRVDTDDSIGEAVHGLDYLMRLDELGVAYHPALGTYDDVQINLCKNLAVRHGWIARKGSGTSALSTLEQTHYSILVGHSHRASLVYHTIHDIDRSATTLLAGEVGCMCRIDSKRDSKQRRFPNYTVLPDWQQGFAVAQIWPDGKFKVDQALYVNGVLLYQDQRYE